jgi:hypothetical protein
MLNHVPLLGLVFGAILLGGGLWRGSEDVARASLGLLAVAGLSALAVYLTGEPAEEVVEGLAGVSSEALEAHEEWGWFALLGSGATGICALGTLLLGIGRTRVGRGAAVLTLILALLASGIVGYTANLGGKISHPELRGNRLPVESDDAPPARNDAVRDREEEEE